MSKAPTLKYILWAIYAGFIGLATLLSVAGIFSTSFFDALLIIFNVAGFIGLYGYINDKEIYKKPFWVLVFVFNVIAFFSSFVAFEKSRWENDIPLTYYGFLLLFLPQLYALYKYANIRLR